MEFYKYTEYSLINEKHKEYIIVAKDFNDLQNKLLEELKLDNGKLCYSKNFNEEYYNCCWEFKTPFGIMTARYGKIEVL